MARLLIAVLMAMLASASSAAAQAPPPQQLHGPGGSMLPFSGAVSQLHDSPAGDQFDYYTFEPRRYAGAPADRPQRLPVVLFMHGYAATDPAAYRYWLDHLVRAGNLVIYPRYQESGYTPTALYTPNAIAAVGDGLAWLRGHSKIDPQLGRGVIIIGHSYGGAVAANISGRWRQAGLPRPAAIFLVEPFVENASYKPPQDAIDENLAEVPRDAEMLCLVADDDFLAGRLGCDEYWERTPQVRARNYLWLHSDDHGEPDLVGNHFGPSARTPPDSIDFRGFWKLGDALRDCALFDQYCGYALGNTRRQRSLGVWADGVPVRPLDVFDELPACPAPQVTLGC